MCQLKTNSLTIKAVEISISWFLLLYLNFSAWKLLNAFRYLIISLYFLSNLVLVKMICFRCSAPSIDNILLPCKSIKFCAIRVEFISLHAMDFLELHVMQGLTTFERNSVEYVHPYTL